MLAGVLMKVGWDIIDWRLLARVHRLRRDHLVVMVMTLALTVFVDLITAVAIGLIAAGMSHARRLERMELDSVVSVPILDRAFFGDAKGRARSDAAAGRETSGAEEPETEDPGMEDPGAHDPYSARVGLVALKGSFTVASSHKLVSVIGADIKDHEVTIFDFSGATYLDDSAAMVIEQLIEVAGRQETEVIVDGRHRPGRGDPAHPRRPAARHGRPRSRDPGRGAGDRLGPCSRIDPGIDPGIDSGIDPGIDPDADPFSAHPRAAFGRLARMA